MGCQERHHDWVWIAVYDEQDRLPECGDGLRAHSGIDQVDLARVRGMVLLPQRAGLPMVQVKLSESMRPIFFRRNYIEINLRSGSNEGSRTIHCLGWEKTLPDGMKVASYTYCFDDGSVLVSDDFMAV